MSAFRSGLLLLLLLGCAPREATSSGHIDHVIVGVSDLHHGMAEIERLTGVRPAIGGAHPGAGTRNALLSLGEGTYLEIYAPNPAEPLASPEVAELRALKHLTPIGWAVSTTNAAQLRSTMKSKGFELTPPEPGSRRKPDGTLLSWVSYGFAHFDHPLAPFFIQWSDPDRHPSRTSPGGCKLESIRIADPSPDRLGRAIEPLGVKVEVATGGSLRMAVVLSCRHRTVNLG